MPEKTNGESRHSEVNVAGAPLGSLLLQVVHEHMTLAHELLGRIGVNPPQELVLLHLEDHGPMVQAELARFLKRDRSTVSVTLAAMERADLIIRNPSPTHRRARLVELTETGRALCPQVRQAWAHLENRSFGALTPTQHEQLATMFTTIRDSLRDRDITTR